MTETPDADLLERFVRNRSEEAFAALVDRYIGLVYSVALRRTSNPEQARDITQAVFIILARKAGGLGRRTVLPGWLYRTAQLTASNFQRTEARRIRREQEAFMQSTLQEPTTDSPWPELAPHLDDAMASLGANERDALVLRYFQNKSVAEVGNVLGLKENTAQQRLGRALEKLRKFFAKHGVASTTAVIAGAISASSAQAAPPGMATTVSAVAVAKGAAASASIITLVEGTMKTMTWLKLKFAVGVIACAMLAVGVATVAVSKVDDSEGPTPQQILERSRAAYAVLTNYSDTGTSTGTVGVQTVPPTTFSIKLARTNLYRIEWKQDYGFFVQTGMVWSAGNGNSLKLGHESRPGQYRNMEGALSAATGVSGGASGNIPGTFFKLNWGNLSMRSPSLKPDEKVMGIDCYVLIETNGERTRTIWIGKQDLLIRQIETDTSAKALTAMLDAAAKRNPAVRKVAHGVSGDVKSVETHENIVVNRAFSPADFSP